MSSVVLKRTLISLERWAGCLQQAKQDAVSVTRAWLHRGILQVDNHHSGISITTIALLQKCFLVPYTALFSKPAHSVHNLKEPATGLFTVACVWYSIEMRRLETLANV